MSTIYITSLNFFIEAAKVAESEYLDQPKSLSTEPLTGLELEDYKRQSSELLEAYNMACRALFTALSLAVKKES